MAGTANFNIAPEDGWVAVTSADTTFVRMRSFPDNHVYYVTAATSTPAATVIGYRVDCKDFWVNVAGGTGVHYYVRTVNPVPGNATDKLRIDVFSI